MKLQQYFSLSVSLLFLFAASFGAAHGNDDDMGSGHMDSGPMMNMDHTGFEGSSEHMIIEGEIIVTNSVQLTVSAEPSDEMNDMMNDHMGSQSNMMQYTNMMTISLTKLVEFADLTDNGYSEDDIVVSDFVMNQTTMLPVELISDSTVSMFVIKSKSNIINITVEMLSENNSPFAFKWSLEINYPFVENNTKLAVLHEMDTTNMEDMMQDVGHMQDQGFDSHMMSDNAEHLPMFFSWDEQYVVDGETRNVTPTLENNIFSLSFDQGSQISYDPQIGFDPEDIQSVDNILDKMGLDQFWETVSTPTIIGITLGLISLVILYASSRIVRTQNK